MNRLSSMLHQGRKALRDLELLAALRSEISHELSSSRVEGTEERGQLPDFVVEWDGAGSRDVLLKRKFESGEEVAVSALLGPITYGIREGDYPRGVEMKVCIRKPGLSSILQLDCHVPCQRDATVPFYIRNAYCIQLPATLGPSVYKGPVLYSSGAKLEENLRRYLVGKGIGKDLTDFLLSHLHRKEQRQYVGWLQNLETMVAGTQ